MAASTDKTNKPLIPRGVDDRPVDKYNRAALYSGKALDFDGVNDSIDISDFSLNGYTAFSICFYKLTDTSASRWVFGNSDSISDGINVYQNADGTIRSRINALNFDTTNNHFKTNGFFVFTYNGTKGDWFVNGQSESTTTQSAQTLSITSGAKIAVPSYTTGSYYDGQLSGFKIFNTALTAAQVADLYNNPEKVVPTGVADSALKLWLPMQEGAGTTVYDGSGNGNHGTINGATWAHGIGAPVAQTAVIDWNKGTNLAQYSEEFDDSYWGLVDTQTPTPNATTAPDGQTTAEKIVPSTNNAIHYIWNTSIDLTGQNTISIFAKYNGYNIGIRPQGIGSGQAFANFDLQNGTILGSGGTSYEDSSITSFSDGWYRISMTMDKASTYGINYYAVNGTTATELPTFTADGTSGYYIWGAQVNAGATLTPYVRTGATAQTSPVLLPQGLTSGRDITGVNLFENVRKQGALNLDGNSWAEVYDNASLDFGTGGFTLEVWAKLAYEDTGSSYNGVLGLGAAVSGNNTAYIYTRSGDVRYFIDGVSFEIASTLDEGNWHHLAVTRTDAGDIQTYYDGAEGEDSGSQADTITNTFDVLIGRDSGNSRYYKDQIAQPRIYNRALTTSEVLNNYNTTKDLYI